MVTKKALYKSFRSYFCVANRLKTKKNMLDLFFAAIVCTLVTSSSSSASASESSAVAAAAVLEYCEREVFEAKCQKDEVILIVSATYGRMKIGRCVKQEYGSIGCKSNVLAVVDSKCSGRRECKFHTSDLHTYSPCPSELVAYLEASYSCLKVAICQTGICQGRGDTSPVPASFGYVASSTISVTSRCGSSECPWVLRPQKGQRFNLTFYNFVPPDSHFEKYCQRLVSLVDKTAKISKDVTVCGGKEGRTVSFTTPESTPMEVVVYGPLSSDNPNYFLLRYEVIGCPDMHESPEGGWSKRDGAVLTVGCDRIRRTWHLTCDGNTWIGEIGTCDEDLDRTAIEQPTWDVGTALQQASNTTQGLLLVVGVGVVLGIILGFSMLAVAVLLIKRRRRLARLELREACMTQLAKNDINNPDNLYNQSTLFGYEDKMSTNPDSLYGASRIGYQSRDLLTGQSDTSRSSVRIFAATGVSSSPVRGFPPPPPPPCAVAGCDTITRIPTS